MSFTKFWSAALRGLRDYAGRPESLVERLRLDSGGPQIHMDYYRADCAEAADEIERLRAEVTRVELAKIGFNA